MEGSVTMPYTISGNDEDGYVLTHTTKPITWSLCPCCDKSLKARRAAEILAHNLEALDDKIEELKP
jgi:hypothetical protein